MMTYGTTRGRHDAIAQAIADRPYLMFSGWDDYADERGWKGVVSRCGVSAALPYISEVEA